MDSDDTTRPSINASDVQYVDVSDLQPHPENPRDGDIEAIKSSIARNGFYGTLVVQDGTNFILAGSHRYLAAKQLGYDALPCIYVQVDADEARRIMLADNRTSDQAGYDEEALDEILYDIAENEQGLEGTGFDDSDLGDDVLDSVLGESMDMPDDEPLEDDGGDIDRAEKLRDEWNTKRGQLWKVHGRDGRAHRILCGDSAEQDEVQTLLEDSEPNLMVTDPPYNVSSDSENYAHDAGETYEKLKGSDWDKDFELTEVFNSLTSVLEPVGSAYVFTSHFLFGELVDYFSNWEHCNYCVWCKPNPMPSLSKRHWTWATELCVYATKQGHTFNFPDGSHALNYWEVTNNNNNFHCTQKPVEIIRKPIIRSSNPGDIVFDPFLGSGTTVVAAENEGRECYGAEIDPEYVAVTLERLHGAGLEPELIREI